MPAAINGALPSGAGGTVNHPPITDPTSVGCLAHRMNAAQPSPFFHLTNASTSDQAALNVSERWRTVFRAAGVSVHGDSLTFKTTYTHHERPILWKRAFAELFRPSVRRTAITQPGI